MSELGRVDDEIYHRKLRMDHMYAEIAGLKRLEAELHKQYVAEREAVFALERKRDELRLL